LSFITLLIEKIVNKTLIFTFALHFEKNALISIPFYQHRFVVFFLYSGLKLQGNYGENG